jgi:hypothetical protein
MDLLTLSGDGVQRRGSDGHLISAAPVRSPVLLRSPAGLGHGRVDVVGKSGIAADALQSNA